ncbi:MAG: branched-chain alpha-keto acid dehydrogenase subunit E2 [Rhodospirillales bacterium 70-18]|nr:2-oxo acid dehydrogenase subunit E2 [Rhodospirillales bacterium]OJY66620.1 MAG: branched-chain alpha-keto acid dehydrogenase subunit E2 [Rhodospirillales bacterium 70-18]
MGAFRMPALGADMESGTLVEWLIKPGDTVKSGDVVAVVETQKGAIEVECFEEGVVASLAIGQGETVPIGTLLAQIGAEAPEPTQPHAPPSPKPAQPQPAPPPAPAPAEPSRIRASPAARRLAAERNIPLATLRGTGIDGAITLADVAAAAAVPRRAAARGFDAVEMRRAIAAAMSCSKRDIPHYYLSETIDLTAALAWLEAFNAPRPPTERLLPAALLLKAAALALRNTPRLNGTFEDGEYRPSPGIHAGWAIALRGGGLVAPAIRDTDRRPLPELMAAIRDLVRRARGGGLRLSELTGGTVTVTSLGERGAESVTGIIYPPQVAIIGFGRVSVRPMVIGDAVAARPAVTASLAADHRVTDGHAGGLYLATVTRLLQTPEVL